MQDEVREVLGEGVCGAEDVEKPGDVEKGECAEQEQRRKRWRFSRRRRRRRRR